MKRDSIHGKNADIYSLRWLKPRAVGAGPDYTLLAQIAWARGPPGW